MVPLPIIVPLFQKFTEKPLSNSPVEEVDSARKPWYDTVTRDQEAEAQDATRSPRSRFRRDIAINIDVEPGVEGGAYATRSDTKAPPLAPPPRLRSFSSLSAWSSRSSIDLPSRSRFRERLQKIVAFALQSDNRQDQGDFIPNYRWLPILSGVTIPFATLLQIPSLTERWYVRTNNNQTIDSRPNPPILLAANIVAMVAALIANLCLILRFLEIRVKPMTLISLCLLSLHDVVNIVAVTVFGIEHRFSDGFTYGQPFWLTVCSTVASLFTTITLLFDLYTTPDFSKSGSGLTRKQRSLVIIVMILLCWIAFGGLVYSLLIHLTFIDGLYFTLVSIETIGFGDIHPISTSGRVFAVFYNTVGILNVALAVTTTRETIIESFENSYRRRSQEIANKRSEYKKYKASERARKAEIERKIREREPPRYLTTNMEKNRGTLNSEKFPSSWREVSRLTNGSKGAETGIEGTAQSTKFDGSLPVSLDTNSEQSGKSYEENYKAFREAMLREERREFVAKLTVAWTIFLTFWLIGAGIFSQTEKWSYGISLYFCFVAFSTIGYGDFSPATPAGRSVFVIWALMGVAAMTILISVLSEAYSSRYKNALAKGSFERTVKNFRERRASSPPPHVTRSRLRSRSLSVDASLDRRYTREHARRDLEALPTELLSHAKTFHEHIYYFLSSLNGNEPPPQALRKLLDEIAESEKMDDRLKREMMGDDGARKTLFMMSYEGALRKMIETAEKAVALLAKRDLVGSDTLGPTNAGQGEDSGTHIPGSHSDPKLRFDFDDQRYKRRIVHMHPQGLASEPNLHLLLPPSSG